MLQFRDIDLSELRVLLCDADDNLFPSEEPAFAASAEVTNAFLDEVGIPLRLTAEELRIRAIGKNFRTIAIHPLCDIWITHRRCPCGPPSRRPDRDNREYRRASDPHPGCVGILGLGGKAHVTSHLRRVLKPDKDVLGPLGKLDAHLALAAVSSSALSRLDACFTATGLTSLIPAVRRYSAEDSLPVPIGRSRPSGLSLRRPGHGCSGRKALAVEDSPSGARSAVAAGTPTIGNVMFVPDGEPTERIRQLRDAGAAAVITCWHELAASLLPAISP